MKNFLFIALLSGLFSSVTFAQVSVIVNSGVGDQTISESKLGSIYTLNTTKWSNGSRIVVVDHKDKNNIKMIFYQSIRKDPVSVQKDWLRKVITGEAKAPETFSSDEDIVRKVSSTPGAIGYVKSSSVTGGVKVVKEIK